MKRYNIRIDPAIYALALITALLLPNLGIAASKKSDFIDSTIEVIKMYIAEQSYTANNITRSYVQFGYANPGKPKDGVLGAKLILPKGLHTFRVGMYNVSGEMIEGIELPDEVHAEQDGKAYDLSVKWQIDSFPKTGIVLILFNEINNSGDISIVGQAPVAAY